MGALGEGGFVAVPHRHVRNYAATRSETGEDIVYVVAHCSGQAELIAERLVEQHHIGADIVIRPAFKGKGNCIGNIEGVVGKKNVGDHDGAAQAAAACLHCCDRASGIFRMICPRGKAYISIIEL